MDTLTMPAVSLPKSDVQRIDKKLHQSENKESVQKAAKQFEAMFINEMMSHIYNEIEVNEYFGGGRGEEIFRSLMVEEYSKKVSDSKQTKISDMLTREMLKMQEQQQNPNQPLSKGV